MPAHLIALWVYVAFVSLLFGGALFERAVMVSAWSSALPASVRNFNTIPGLVLEPGRFFVWVTPPVMLLAPINLYFALHETDAGRGPLIASTIVMIVVIVATLVYYLPTLRHLIIKQGEGLDDAAVVRVARRWVALQYVRLTLVGFAWLAALCAFRLAS